MKSIFKDGGLYCEVLCVSLMTTMAILHGYLMHVSWSKEISSVLKESSSTEVKSSGKGFIIMERNCVPVAAMFIPHFGSKTWQCVSLTQVVLVLKASWAHEKHLRLGTMRGQERLLVKQPSSI